MLEMKTLLVVTLIKNLYNPQEEGDVNRAKSIQTEYLGKCRDDKKKLLVIHMSISAKR